MALYKDFERKRFKYICDIGEEITGIMLKSCNKVPASAAKIKSYKYFVKKLNMVSDWIDIIM